MLFPTQNLYTILEEYSFHAVRSKLDFTVHYIWRLRQWSLGLHLANRMMRRWWDTADFTDQLLCLTWARIDSRSIMLKLDYDQEATTRYKLCPDPVHDAEAKTTYIDTNGPSSPQSRSKRGIFYRRPSGSGGSSSSSSLRTVSSPIMCAKGFITCISECPYSFTEGKYMPSSPIFPTLLWSILLLPFFF